MMRILLILLAVVIAVLAFVLDQTWLYWAAGALLAAAVVALVVYLWQQYQEAVRFRQKKARAAADRHQELNDLGIVDVRPRSRSSQPSPEADRAEEADAPAPDAPAPDAPAPDAPSSEAATASTEASEIVADGVADGAAEPDEAAPADDAPPADEDPVFGPYLQALQAAVEAHTACLLVQEEVALAYRIEAMASQRADSVASGIFETDEPLLTPGMTRRAVTVRTVGEEGIDPALLGYYRRPPALEQAAFIPVPCPSVPATYFLVVDAADRHLQAPRAEKVLTQFAELLGLLIEIEEASGGLADEEVPEVPAEETAPPRPRREIVAEEMAKAYQDSRPLALVLVHLNRAEALAEQGPTVVADAEETLRTRLERSAPRSRVERFGELTHGVFYNGFVADVEPWAERLQEEMKQASGVLAGGVSIGIAMMHADDPQAPERLREEATEALRVAYQTGTCTIIE